MKLRTRLKPIARATTKLVTKAASKVGVKVATTASEAAVLVNRKSINRMKAQASLIVAQKAVDIAKIALKGFL